jgi:predicted RNA-binding protein
MVRYWILSMVESNYFIAKEHGLIGVSPVARKVIQQMSTGDMIVFYISKKHAGASRTDPTERVRQFRGIAQVTGNAFESRDVIWPARDVEIFPHRRRVEFLSDMSTDFKPLIERLSFVTNTLLWALPLQKGYVEVTRNDFELIQDAMKATPPAPMRSRTFRKS